MDLTKLNNQFSASINGRIINYLKGRCLSDDTIKKFGVGYAKNVYGKDWVTIPITDSDNNLLFFKLRKDPFNDKDGEKYSYYPTGNKSALFNKKILSSVDSIIVCEGEFDCMVLDEQGIPAITSTSGAGTFKNEWVKDLKNLKEITICFDADDSGKKGMSKLAEKLSMETEAQIYTIDLSSVMKDGKDITDYFVKAKLEPDKYNLNNFLLLKQPYHSKVFDGLETAKDIYEKKIEHENQWLVQDIIPSGVFTIVSGDSGTGKSYLVLYLVSCIVFNKKAFEKLDVIHGNVLIIDEENPVRTLSGRIHGLELNTVNLSFYHYQGLKIDKKEDMTKIIKTAILKKVNLVVFDSLVRLHDLDENSADQMKYVHEMIKPLLVRNIAVLIIHHSGKSQVGRDITLRGSSEIKAAVDCHLFVKKTIDKNVICIQNRKLRFAPELGDKFVKIKEENNKMTFELIESFKADKSDPVQMVFDFINKSEEPQDINTIKDNLKIGESKLREILKNLVDSNSLIEETKSHNKKTYMVNIV